MAFFNLHLVLNFHLLGSNDKIIENFLHELIAILGQTINFYLPHYYLVKTYTYQQIPSYSFFSDPSWPFHLSCQTEFSYFDFHSLFRYLVDLCFAGEISLRCGNWMELPMVLWIRKFHFWWISSLSSPYAYLSSSQALIPVFRPKHYLLYVTYL